MDRDDKRDLDDEINKIWTAIEDLRHKIDKMEKKKGWSKFDKRY